MHTVRQLYTATPQDQITVQLQGFVKSNRGSNKVGFIVFNDGTYFNNLQVVYSPDSLANFDEIRKLRISSSVQITGVLVHTPQAKQPFEVKATTIQILKACDEDYPLQKKEHSYEFLREISHLRPRTNTFSAVFRIRSSCALAIHQYFNDNDFIYVNTPIITGNDAEGAGEAFVVTTRTDGDYEKDFFGKKASLTVSGQLHAEGFAQALNRVYTFGPTFRAEDSNTTKHAAEFWMIEPEMAFADLAVNMDCAEGLVKYVINYLFDHNRSELQFLNDNVDATLIDKLEHVRSSDFVRMPYAEAITAIQTAIKAGHEFEMKDVVFGTDLQTEHERYICEVVTKKPTFLIDYPKEIKAFYMKLNNDNRTVAACDLLVPGIGELVGGSQREADFDKIMDRCATMGIEPADLQWYIDMRRYGYYMSSGFGLGFERLIMYVTGMANIRDVIPFPRTPRNLLF